jgi:hypothetical protein
MNYQKGTGYTVSLFVLLIGVLLLTNPVLGYSQLLPGGIFELTYGDSSWLAAYYYVRSELVPSETAQVES